MSSNDQDVKDDLDDENRGENDSDDAASDAPGPDDRDTSSPTSETEPESDELRDSTISSFSESSSDSEASSDDPGSDLRSSLAPLKEDLAKVVRKEIEFVAGLKEPISESDKKTVQKNRAAVEGLQKEINALIDEVKLTPPQLDKIIKSLKPFPIENGHLAIKPPARVATLLGLATVAADEAKEAVPVATPEAGLAPGPATASPAASSATPATAAPIIAPASPSPPASAATPLSAPVTPAVVQPVAETQDDKKEKPAAPTVGKLFDPAELAVDAAKSAAPSSTPAVAPMPSASSPVKEAAAVHGPVGLVKKAAKWVDQKFTGDSAKSAAAAHAVPIDQAASVSDAAPTPRVEQSDVAHRTAPLSKSRQQVLDEKLNKIHFLSNTNILQRNLKTIGIEQTMAGIQNENGEYSSYMAMDKGKSGRVFTIEQSKVTGKSETDEDRRRIVDVFLECQKARYEAAGRKDFDPKKLTVKCEGHNADKLAELFKQRGIGVELSKSEPVSTVSTKEPEPKKVVEEDKNKEGQPVGEPVSKKHGI